MTYPGSGLAALMEQNSYELEEVPRLVCVGRQTYVSTANVRCVEPVSSTDDLTYDWLIQQFVYVDKVKSIITYTDGRQAFSYYPPKKTVYLLNGES